MQPYDILMLIVLVAATVFGAWKGLAWQLASLGSIFLSYFVAHTFREPLAQVIDASPPWNVFLSMLILFIGTSLAVWIAFRFVSDFIDRLKLKEFDRQIGALFGIAKGVLLCVIITLFAVTLLGDNQRRQIVGSRSGYYIAVLLDRAHPIMPPEIHDVLEPYIHSLDERLGDDNRFYDHATNTTPWQSPLPAQPEPTQPPAGQSLFDAARDAIFGPPSQPSDEARRF